MWGLNKRLNMRFGLLANLMVIKETHSTCRMEAHTMVIVPIPYDSFFWNGNIQCGFIRTFGRYVWKYAGTCTAIAFITTSLSSSMEPAAFIAYFTAM
ncbi:hypothetical protein SESBI_01796 [Sesbania bispinosa]|nr:hypothetical protein SESBI_01796 [Sesbania bispinosa]